MDKIIVKYLEGRATEKEQHELLEWMRIKENRKTFHNSSLDWEKSLDKNVLPAGGEKVWLEIQTQLLQKGTIKLQKSRKIQRFLKVAAIFLAIISIGNFAYNFSSRNESVSEYTTSVIAEKGQVSKIEMPDGSTVWLNSGSKLTYNNHFASKNRDVELEGEAYFSVTRNEKLPMVVNCGELSVNVLGTKFNVRSYPKSEHISVILEGGSIELLNSRVESFSYKLTPGQLARFDKSSKNLTVSRVETSRYTSWKEGIINVYNQSLEELIERLELHYNQKFVIEDNVKDFHYTFTIRNETMDEIIKLMEKISPIKVIQKSDTVFIELDEDKKRKVDGEI